MKKSPADYTQGETKYAARKLAAKASKPNAHTYLRNSAVTKAGDFIIGLSYNTELQRYSCSAIEIDGVRDNGKLCSWDNQGNALEADLSDLRLESVQVGVRTI